jgi:hypothetical protein
MRSVEELSRWQRLANPFAKVLDFAFACRHSHLSRVFTIRGRTYKVCCDCGADFDYSLKDMEILDRRPSRARLRHLRIRHI